MMAVAVTSPKRSNAVRSAFSSVAQARPPTNSLFVTSCISCFVGRRNCQLGFGNPKGRARQLNIIAHRSTTSQQTSRAWGASGSQSSEAVGYDWCKRFGDASSPRRTTDGRACSRRARGHWDFCRRGMRFLPHVKTATKMAPTSTPLAAVSTCSVNPPSAPVASDHAFTR